MSSTNRQKHSEWFCISLTHAFSSHVYLFEAILSIMFCHIQGLSRCRHSASLDFSVTWRLPVYIYMNLDSLWFIDIHWFIHLSIGSSSHHCLSVIVCGPLSLLVNLHIFYCTFVMLILCHQFWYEIPVRLVHNLKFRLFVSEVRMWGSFPLLGSAMCCASPGPWLSLCSSSDALILCNILSLMCLCSTYHCYLFPDFFWSALLPALFRVHVPVFYIRL